MKLIDVNASVGHWPFRSLPYRTVDDLLAQMDKAGIEQACVCCLHGLFYKDVHQANEELARDTLHHRDRLIPVATLNPEYVCWRDDLKCCVEERGFRALRLFPLYHRYEMHAGTGLDLLQAAAELELPVQIPIRVVDPRQMHPLDVDRMLTLDEIAQAVRACPQGRYVVLDHRGGPPEAFRALRDQLGATVYFDLAREPVVFNDQGRSLVDAVGIDRLLFGTAMLHKPPEVALLRFQHLPVDQRQRERIAWQNAAVLFA
ncbi:MAG: amidohydrolase family protein [Phycisphaerae bacterium]|nr:amidohydrolase family protein [Phycisphaerae bacterium]